MAKFFKQTGSPFWKTDVWVNGSKFRFNSKCTSLKEAERALPAFVALKTGEVAEQEKAGGSLELQYVVERYMRDVGNDHANSDDTERECNRLIQFFGEKRDITTITHNDAAELRAWRRAQTYGKHNPKPVSNRTVNVTLLQLQRLITNLKDNHHTQFSNEPKWSKLLLEEQKEHVRELSGDEQDRLDAAVDEMRPDLRPLIDYAQIVAKRKTESYTLCWRQVKWDLDRGDGYHGVIETIGKGGKLSVTKIDDEMRSILLPLRGNHPEFVFTFVAQRTFDKTVKGKQYRLVKGQHYPWTRDGLRRAWDTVRGHAGLTGDDRFRWHDFRHDYASKALRLADGATGMKVVQETLGHSDIKTTLARYAHLVEGAVSDTRQRVAAHRRARKSTTDGTVVALQHYSDQRKAG